MPLTDEQRAQIERNKAEALKKAAARKAREAATTAPSASAQDISEQKKQIERLKALAVQRAEERNLPSTSRQSMQPKVTWVQVSDTKPKVTVTLTLAPNDRVKTSFYPFHKEIVNVLKSAPSSSFDADAKVWSFNLTDLRQTTAKLREVQSATIEIESIPDNVIVLNNNVRLTPVPKSLETILDPNLVSQLFQYQKDGVRFALEREGRVIFADEMGLGKSLQALATARYYRSEWPLVIVCPASVKCAWKNQINKFIPSIHRIHMIDSHSDPLPTVQTSNTVVIMSYEQMIQRYKELKDEKYRVYIFDECHLLKERKARRTQTAMDLAKTALRVLLLSGTPALSRPAELYTQIRIVDHKAFPNFQNFATRYCDGKQGRFGFESKGCTNSEELSAILLKRLMIRRLKNDVLTDLPAKRREVVFLSGDKIQSSLAILKEARKEYERVNKMDSDKTHQMLLQYFQQTGVVKAQAVCEHVLDTYFFPDAPPRKVIIFAHHQVVLDTLEVQITKKKLKYIRIDGSVGSKDRGELCRKFQEEDNVLVALLSLTAAGVGITLTAASIVVFAEIHFNPGILVQAEDRAHRVGQKDSVFVQYLIAKNTADDVMWSMVQAKLDVLSQVNLSSDTFRTADRTHITLDSPEKKQKKIDSFFSPTKSKSFENEFVEDEAEEEPIKKRAKVLPEEDDDF